MPRYQRAYVLGELRLFEGWPPSAGAELTAEALVFLDEDLRVHTSAVNDAASLLFSSDAPSWRKFCTEVLHFEVPDWEKEAAEVRAALAGRSQIGEP